MKTNNLTVIKYVTPYHNWAIAFNGTRLTAHGFATKKQAASFIAEAELKGFSLVAAKEGCVIRSCIIEKNEKVKTISQELKFRIAFWVGGAWCSWCEHNEFISRDSDSRVWKLI